jgi:hypothetical protein
MLDYLSFVTTAEEIYHIHHGDNTPKLICSGITHGQTSKSVLYHRFDCTHYSHCRRDLDHVTLCDHHNVAFAPGQLALEVEAAAV